MEKYFLNYKMELGNIIVIYDKIGVTNVIPPYEKFCNTSELIYREDEGILAYLNNYFTSRETGKLKLNIKTSEFQNKVYNILLSTKMGTTLTYGDVAKLIGCTSPRAIGQALKKNPVPVIIPCHRVIGKGWEGGFGGEVDGIKMDFKRYLLKLEGV